MRPDSLHHTTHYQMSDYRHKDSAERASADQLALQVWADCWTDAHILRTTDPVRFDFRRVSVWCSPTPVFESATWTEEQRILNYYSQREA